MIIEFTKRKNFYDDLETELYGMDAVMTMCYNFTPVEIFDEHYILTSAKNLEGYLMDYKNNAKIKLYIENENKEIECTKIQLNNIVVFNSNTSNMYFSTQPDCYIDLLCDLLLIKFNSSKLNYIRINNNLNCDDLRYAEETIGLKYIWMDDKLELNTICKLAKILNVWTDKYINLPQIPLMIDIGIENNGTELLQTPIIGSPVYDNNNNFFGIISPNIDHENIVIIPLISIKKICDYVRL